MLASATARVEIAHGCESQRPPAIAAPFNRRNGRKGDKIVNAPEDTGPMREEVSSMFFLLGASPAGSSIPCDQAQRQKAFLPRPVSYYHQRRRLLRSHQKRQANSSTPEAKLTAFFRFFRPVQSDGRHAGIKMKVEWSCMPCISSLTLSS